MELNRLIEDGAKFTVITRQTPALIREVLAGCDERRRGVQTIRQLVIHDPHVHRVHVVADQLTVKVTRAKLFLDQRDVHVASRDDEHVFHIRIGVDSLDVGMGAGGSPMVGASRAIGNRLSVGVRTGASPSQSGVSANVDVTRNIRVETDVDAKGSTSVGVGTRFEW